MKTWALGIFTSVSTNFKKYEILKKIFSVLSKYVLERKLKRKT